MRRALTLLTALAALGATLAAAQEISSDPTAAEVLDRALEALGGEEALAALESWAARGTIEVSGFSGPYETWAQAPNRQRTAFDLNVIQIESGFDGEEGWRKRGDSLSAVTGADLERTRRDALFLPLLAYALSGTPVELMGRETVGEAQAWMLELEPRPGARERFYIDAESHLPLREVLVRTGEDGEDESLTIDYGDYREVDGVRFPFSITRTTPSRAVVLELDAYEPGVGLEASFFESPAKRYAGEPYAVSVSTVPRKVFKENDGLFGEGSTESWLVHVLVDEKHSRPIEATAATVELFAGEERVETRTLDRAALAAVHGVTFTGLAGLREVFDLRLQFARPTALAVDRMVVTLALETAAGDHLEESLEVPIHGEGPKTALSFPLEGNFMVLGGSDFNEPHKQEWSQHFALDILALGPNFELSSGAGDRNEDFVTWGREIVAPADGTVSYARNDVLDNASPGTVDRDAFAGLPDPLWAIGGNCVVIDHGNGEFSFLAHMQHGSVRVATGDSVRKGQLLGLLGNSGNSGAPHLHYHLMAGDTLFRSDGLPLRFDNVYFTETFGGELAGAIKRGVYFQSRWPPEAGGVRALQDDG